MKYLLLALLLTGCASVFEDPAVWTESDFSGEFGGAVAKVHYDANSTYGGLNSTCLPNAKYTMLGMYEIGKTPENGYTMTLIRLRPFSDSRDHAMLLIQGHEFGSDGIIFDNGYISPYPFPVAELDHHGTWEALDEFWVNNSIFEHMGD